MTDENINHSKTGQKDSRVHRPSLAQIFEEFFREYGGVPESDSELRAIDGTPYPKPYDEKTEEILDGMIAQGDKDINTLSRLALGYHDSGNFGAEGEHRELIRLIVAQNEQILNVQAANAIYRGQERINDDLRWQALAKDNSWTQQMIQAIGDMVAGLVKFMTEPKPETPEPLQDPFEHIQHLFQPGEDHLSFCDKRIPPQYTLGMSAEDERALLHRPICIDCYRPAVAYIRQDERAKILKEQDNG